MQMLKLVWWPQDKFMPMVVAVLADESQKSEFLAKGVPDSVEVIWVDSVKVLVMVEANAYFDLLFEYDNERRSKLKSIEDAPVFINSVVFTAREIENRFIRINAWPTMLTRPVVEIAGPMNNDANRAVHEIFKNLEWQYEVVPDIVGMITPRVVAMIINEAWYALGEGVSTREEIDVAMKLGTNYPYGPFEWGDLIGLDRVRFLLTELQRADSRYAMAPKLKNL
jgi:3-hydroxybutyryl-CoA dehydrogenase